MAVDEKIINVRIMRGLNFTEDARITAPGSWRELRNYYNRSPGVIAKRPGSILVSRTFVAPISNPVINATTAGSAWSVLNKVATDNEGNRWQRNYLPIRVDAPLTFRPKVGGYSQGSAGGADAPTINGNSRGTKSDNLPLDQTVSPTPAILSHTTFAGASKITGLSRIFLPYSSTGYWIGAMDLENPYPDALWWLDSNDKMKAIPALPGLITTSQAEWTIFPYRPGSISEQWDNSNSGTVKPVVAIATNGIDPPIKILDFSQVDATQPFELAHLEVQSVTDLPSASHYLTGVRSICLYAGQVCWGGFRMTDFGNSDTKIYDHCIIFSEPDTSSGDGYTTLTDNGTDLNFIKIGADINEPITAVVPISSITDAEGIHGALAVFTTKKVAIYTGLPPVSGADVATSFNVAAIGDVGCASPRTVVRTPDGVVFLGTDGIVYLISLNNRIVPISRAVAPELANRSARQLARCAAVFDGEFYKLSYPQKNRSVSASAGTFGQAPSPNNLQMWANMQYLDFSKPDAGVFWDGPHEGQHVSVFHRSNELEDDGVIYAGLSDTVGLIQVNRFDKASDPNPADLTSTLIFSTRAVTGSLDLGDAHVDKSVAAVSIGISTDKEISIVMVMGANGEIAGRGVGATSTKTVSPGSSVLGASSFLLGQAAFLAGDDNFSLPTHQPPEVIRGRTFEAVIEERSPSVEAFTAISDLQFRIKLTERRST